MSMLVSATALTRPTKFRHLFIIIILLLTSIVYWLIEVISKQRRLDIMMIDDKLKDSK